MKLQYAETTPQKKGVECLSDKAILPIFKCHSSTTKDSKIIIRTFGKKKFQFIFFDLVGFSNIYIVSQIKTDWVFT